MAGEQEPTALTRDQLVAIEALRQANQTLLETFVKTSSEDSGTAVRNFVLETAQAYRDFINDHGSEKAGA